ATFSTTTACICNATQAIATKRNVNFRIFDWFNDINTNLQILFLFSEKSARFFCESPHFFAVMPLNIKSSE
ncbi:MAG: hypothetical protein MSA44_02430, partial [Bacteroidales bacterium]|nr:hypothetical protein [Bacteroidales bacterium]